MTSCNSWACNKTERKSLIQIWRKILSILESLKLPAHPTPHLQEGNTSSFVKSANFDPSGHLTHQTLFQVEIDYWHTHLSAKCSIPNLFAKSHTDTDYNLNQNMHLFTWLIKIKQNIENRSETRAHWGMQNAFVCPFFWLQWRHTEWS